MPVRNCSACGRPMNADLPACPWCKAGVAAPDPGTRPCPFCQEPIRREAIKCRWCGESLGAPGARAAPVPPPPRPAYAPPPSQAPPGTLPLVLGIIGLAGGFAFCGLPLILSPFAWITGQSYENRCRAMRVEPDGTGKAGKILGIIGTAFLVLGVLFFGVMIAIAAASDSRC